MCSTEYKVACALQAWRELGLIVIVVAVTMLMFASVVFAFERDGGLGIIAALIVFVIIIVFDAFLLINGVIIAIQFKSSSSS